MKIDELIQIFRRSILALALATIPFAGWSQTGPGGVGDRTGASILDLWYDANDLDGDGVIEGANESGLTGTDVTSWADKSGNGINAIDVAPPYPLYQSSGNNGYPRLDFNGSAQFLKTNTFTRSANETIFCVSTVLDTDNRTIYDGNTVNSRRLYSAVAFHPGLTHDHLSITTSNNGSPNFGNFGVGINNTVISRVFFSSTVNEHLQVNQNTTVIADGGNTPSTNALTLGAIGNGEARLNGNISEIFIYSGSLNSAQSTIIHNYLSAKYGLNLLSLDLYDEDNASNGNFDHDVAGIGRVDASNLHDDAQGTGIVRVLNPSGLDNDEYFIWGHNNGIQQAIEVSDVPAGVQARFDRLWRVSEVNSSSTAIDVGAIDVRFDLTGYDPINVTDLRLIVDTDNDGVFNDESTIGGATSQGSNIFQFAGVTALNNNSRFTIGTINSILTPLPITLISFTADVVNNNYVKFNWQTATETNNDYFTIERSTDGIKWELLQKVNGAGNSSSLLHYESTDRNPYIGTSYYRLKQTDYDGQHSYSQIRSVDVKNDGSTTVDIFPNPTKDLITLESHSIGVAPIKIYNVIGQDVTEMTKLVNKDSSRIVLDLSDLVSGMYFIKTITTVKVYKQ